MTTEFKGAPGPWYVEELNGIAVCRIHETAEGSDKSWISNVYDDDDWERCRATARLIAAAPDLLELARRTRWLLAQKPYPGRERDEAAILTEAEAAIAKALGN